MVDIIDERTTGRGWLLPHPDNELQDDIDRLRAALQAADGDVTAILVSLGQKAALLHSHAMSDISGLVSALDGKLDNGATYALDDLSDVDVSAAANGQVVMKQGSLFIPVALQINHVVGLEAAITGKLDAATLISAPAKATLVNGDKMLIVDVVGNVVSTSLWSVVKSTMKTATDLLYATTSHVHAIATTTVDGFMSAADKVKLDALVDDPWGSSPIGVPIPVFDHITGLAPPTNKAYRFVKLTAGDTTYNSTFLTSESVSGSAPLITATAVVSSVGSLLHGATINLINTERRFLRAGSSGALEAAALASHTHSGTADSGGAHVHTGTTDSTGAHTHTTPVTGAGLSGSGTGAGNLANLLGSTASGSAGTHSHTLTIASGGAHTHTLTIAATGGSENTVKNIGVTYYMRIK